MEEATGDDGGDRTGCRKERFGVGLVALIEMVKERRARWR